MKFALRVVSYSVRWEFPDQKFQPMTPAGAHDFHIDFAPLLAEARREEG